MFPLKELMFEVEKNQQLQICSRFTSSKKEQKIKIKLFNVNRENNGDLYCSKQNRIKKSRQEKISATQVFYILFR